MHNYAVEAHVTNAKNVLDEKNNNTDSLEYARVYSRQYMSYFLRIAIETVMYDNKMLCVILEDVVSRARDRLCISELELQ